MNNETDEKKEFSYTYKAPTKLERREIEAIQKQYLPKVEETKLERLKRLDSKVQNTALIIALVVGIGGMLIFGLGLTFCLEWGNFIVGVIIAVVGGICAGISYPISRIVLKKQKEKYGDEILMISKELLNEDTNETQE